MKGNTIYLICGKSGSGKDTIVSELCKVFGFKQVKSYTTRPKRYPSEDTHIFVTDEEYDQLTNLVAETRFDKYRYCATYDQIDNADFYIVDKNGVETFKQRYKGDKKVKVVYIDRSYKNRLKSMVDRGDSIEKVNDRLYHDDYAFTGIERMADFIIDNNGEFFTAVYALYKYVAATSIMEDAIRRTADVQR